MVSRLKLSDEGFEVFNASFLQMLYDLLGQEVGWDTSSTEAPWSMVVTGGAGGILTIG